MLGVNVVSPLDNISNPVPIACNAIPNTNTAAAIINIAAAPANIAIAPTPLLIIAPNKATAPTNANIDTTAIPTASQLTFINS